MQPLPLHGRQTMSNVHIVAGGLRLSPGVFLASLFDVRWRDDAACKAWALLRK